MTESEDLKRRWGKSKIMDALKESMRKQLLKSILESRSRSRGSAAPKIKIPIQKLSSGSILSKTPEIGDATVPKGKGPILRSLDDDWQS